MRHINPYIEYAACDQCGYRKYCRLVGNKFFCRSCDIMNLYEQREKKS